MTKEKILEFYNKAIQEGIPISKIRYFRNYRDSEIELILNSKYPKVMMDLILDYQFKLLTKNEQEQTVHYINDAKNEQHAIGIYDIVSTGLILSSGLATKILEVLDKATIEAIPSIISLALNYLFLMNPKAFEIMRIIGESTQEYSILCATDIAKNLESLIHPEILEIIKIASTTEGEEQCKLVNSMAKNRDVLSFDLAVELITLASKIKKDKESLELMISVSNNKLLDKHRYSTHYLVMMFEANTPESVLKIYNEAEQKTIDLKIQESKLKKDNELFWNAYKDRPTKTIKLLDMFESSEEITPHTRIRKMGKTDE